jgi:hypothetical protein
VNDNSDPETLFDDSAAFGLKSRLSTCLAATIFSRSSVLQCRDSQACTMDDLSEDKASRAVDIRLLSLLPSSFGRIREPEVRRLVPASLRVAESVIDGVASTAEPSRLCDSPIVPAAQL